MSLILIFKFIAISGIFKKRDELDILPPPPPPFPEIGKDEKELRAAERLREKGEKKRAKELEQKGKEEEKRKLEERRRKDKLKEGRERERKKKVFDFFHGLGVVKTEEEKREIIKRKENAKRQRELERKRRKDEKIKLEGDRKRREREKQKELSLKRKEEEKKVKEDTHFMGKQKLEKKVPKKKPFLGLFGKKKVDFELEKELKEIEEITPKPVKKIKEEKLEIPELEEIKKEIEKPELASAEEEIQKAIQGMKVKKRPSIVKRFWKKKEKVKEKIETPEVMPRTYDKIDYVELIEEKMHKARLALMNFKFDEAKRIYIEVMRMYNDLEPKKKAKVYEDIKDLYYERKSAEKFAK